MKKNVLRLTILCATLSLPLFTTTSCLTEDITEDIINENFEYQKKDGEITILNYIGSYNDVEVPSTIEGKNVTSIDVNAFKNNMNLTSVKFNRNLTSIPTGLLEGQENIKTLGIFIGINTTLRELYNVTDQSKLPTSLENIEYSYINNDSNDWSSFFNGVSRAYNFKIPSNGSEFLPSFEGCTNIKTLDYPESYKFIRNYGFSCCSSLTSIIIPESVTSISKKAFFKCSSLTSITIPDGVTSIGDDAFAYCSSLTSITIPDGVENIGYYAFSSCSSLTSITIPYGVKSIESGTFCDCSSLTSITIPDGVTSIGYEAFEGCSSLTSITIPDSVENIGYYAFSHCSSLTSITIPDGVTSIGTSAFRYCSSLTSITIPHTVIDIGNNAFYNCYNLDITYNGTMEEWNVLVYELEIGSVKSVICTDGIITQ